ncbi:serine/threonine-protein kinase [Nocardioides psychrotolerans]|uniref:serine/threonine-protein kinase n=1 Tax=Nocardioides psychrotolerans TaxID=1005945 RepID=UPI003137DC9B
MADAALDLPPGYELVRRLGAGGFGEVFLARQPAIGRLVAIKRILPHALTDTDNLERFRREARILASTRCRSVVKVYDLMTGDGGALLVMEYVPGVNLLDLLDGERLPVDQAMVVLRDVAEALAAMAEQGVVHRDVKPGNVFVLPDGHARLGDFGLARAVADASGFRTGGGAPSGTPAYFPPEVSQGIAEPSPASDAYSFAVMAYETLLGRRPFDAGDAVALVIAHWEHPPVPPRDVLPGVPAAAADALLAGLDKDPGQRLLPLALVDRLAAVPAGAWPPAAWREPAADSARSDPTVVAVAQPATRAGDDPAPARRASSARSRSSKERLRAVGAAVAAAAVAALVAVVVLVSPWDSPLEVTSVEVEASTRQGTCPRAAFVFTGLVRTNGEAGTLTLQWTRPDGVPNAKRTVRVAAGQQRVSARLEFTMRGSRPLEGAAVLTVLRPDSVHDSALVGYTCRGRRTR